MLPPFISPKLNVRRAYIEARFNEHPSQKLSPRGATSPISIRLDFCLLAREVAITPFRGMRVDASVHSTFYFIALSRFFAKPKSRLL